MFTLFRILFGLIKIVVVFVLFLIALLLLPIVLSSGFTLFALDGVLIGICLFVLPLALVFGIIRFVFHLAFHTLLTITGFCFLVVGIGFYLPLLAASALFFLAGWIMYNASIDQKSVHRN